MYIESTILSLREKGKGGRGRGTKFCQLNLILCTTRQFSSCPLCLPLPLPAQVGELVYAVVTRAHPHIEPELSCVDGSGKSVGLGQLSTAGYLLKCSLGLCRK